MNEVQRVLIVGGGIAGMALAIVLRRAGIAIEIAEIDKDWRVYGAGITVSGPTLRALDQLGLLDAVVREGYCYDTTRICDSTGKVIMASRTSGRPMGPRIPNGGGILRPILHRILAEATRASGAIVRLDVSVTAVEQSDSAASVRFTDGSSAGYDLIIGADGIHSRLRAMLFLDAPTPEFTGQGCWRAVLKRPADVDCAHVYVGGAVKAGSSRSRTPRCICFCSSTCRTIRACPSKAGPNCWLVSCADLKVRSARLAKASTARPASIIARWRSCCCRRRGTADAQS